MLVGYGAGTTFTRVGRGNSNTYQINDNGYIETITIYATGQVHRAITRSSPPRIGPSLSGRRRGDRAGRVGVTRLYYLAKSVP